MIENIQKENIKIESTNDENCKNLLSGMNQLQKQLSEQTNSLKKDFEQKTVSRQLNIFGNLPVFINFLRFRILTFSLKDCFLQFFRNNQIQFLFLKKFVMELVKCKNLNRKKTNHQDHKNRHLS